MFGWFKRARAWASRVKRSANCPSRSFSRERILSATRRFRRGCRALYTTPMPPWPRHSRISSCGNSAAISAGVIGGWTILVPCGPTPPGPSVCAERPALSMHSGQIPPKAVGGTGFPQCGHLFSSFISSLPSPHTKEELAKGYTHSQAKMDGGRLKMESLAILQSLFSVFATASPRQRPEQIPQFILHFFRGGHSIGDRFAQQRAVTLAQPVHGHF